MTNFTGKLKNPVPAVYLVLFILCAFFLTACGAAHAVPAKASPSPEVTEPTATPTPVLPVNIVLSGTDSDCRAEISGIMTPEALNEALSALSQFPEKKIRVLHFPATELTEQEARLVSERYPEAEIDAMITFGGKKFNLGVSALGIPEINHEKVSSLGKILPLMKNLTEVDLGEESKERNLTWEDIALLEKSAPKAVFRYGFTLYEKHFNLGDEKMSLHHKYITDEGALVRQVISLMRNLTYLDMDSTNVSDESMAKIRDDFPNIKVVWRVWFGENYSVRTDVKKILASCPGNGGNLTVENTKSLKYCTEVKYLDIGHNEVLHDISFISYMPDLEVAILAMDYFSDTTPIADCPHLEFLEIQTNEITDLTPLAGLKELKHLNIGHNYDLCDITPLYGLTQLKRLWIGSIDPVPQEQVEEMQRRAPDCEINTEVWDPHAGNWRYDASRESGFSERYELLVQQFGYDTLDYSYYWMDPYYYEDGRIPWVYMDSVYDD